MLIYEKDNKLNINFDNSIEAQPDVQLSKEDGKVNIEAGGEPVGGGNLYLDLDNLPKPTLDDVEYSNVGYYTTQGQPRSYNVLQNCFIFDGEVPPIIKYYDEKLYVEKFEVISTTSSKTCYKTIENKTSNLCGFSNDTSVVKATYGNGLSTTNICLIPSTTIFHHPLVINM